MTIKLQPVPRVLLAFTDQDNPDEWETLCAVVRNYAREAVLRDRAAAPQPPSPAQQPLTDEHKAILMECRNQAMRWTLDARPPEAGAFGGIAQDLDYLCAQLADLRAAAGDLPFNP